MQISQFFMNGDIKGAIAYMREHEEFKDILPAYAAIFEDCEYRTYEIPTRLNDILRLYQIYYRDVFYCGLPETEAADKLLRQLRILLDMPEADEALLTARLQAAFEAEGYHALFGKTQGYYGPYIWKETVPTVYRVALPDGAADYTVNILKGFVFRSWMDYLTFGRYGAGGWASPDGTINCIGQDQTRVCGHRSGGARRHPVPGAGAASRAYNGNGSKIREIKTASNGQANFAGIQRSVDKSRKGSGHRCPFLFSAFLCGFDRVSS